MRIIGSEEIKNQNTGINPNIKTMTASVAIKGNVTP
jgi:hypothetical protein